MSEIFTLNNGFMLPDYCLMFDKLESGQFNMEIIFIVEYLLVILDIFFKKILKIGHVRGLKSNLGKVSTRKKK